MFPNTNRNEEGTPQSSLAELKGKIKARTFRKFQKTEFSVILLAKRHFSLNDSGRHRVICLSATAFHEWGSFDSHVTAPKDLEIDQPSVAHNGFHYRPQVICMPESAIHFRF